jgi:hypothetical protein
MEAAGRNCVVAAAHAKGSGVVAMSVGVVEARQRSVIALG